MERRDFESLTRLAGYLRAGGQCECTGCGLCGYGFRCSSPLGNDYEADHVVSRDDNSPANLQLLCKTCHRFKTDSAGALARAIFGSQTAEYTAYANALVEALKTPPPPTCALGGLAALAGVNPFFTPPKPNPFLGPSPTPPPSDALGGLASLLLNPPQNVN